MNEGRMLSAISERVIEIDDWIRFTIEGVTQWHRPVAYNGGLIRTRCGWFIRVGENYCARIAREPASTQEAKRCEHCDRWVVTAKGKLVRAA